MTTANSIATVVSPRSVLTPRQAVMLAAVTGHGRRIFWNGRRRDHCLRPRGRPRSPPCRCSCCALACGHRRWSRSTWRFGHAFQFVARAHRRTVRRGASRRLTATGRSSIVWPVPSARTCGGQRAGAFCWKVIVPMIATARSRFHRRASSFMGGLYLLLLRNWRPVHRRPHLRQTPTRRAAGVHGASAHGTNDAQKTMGVITRSRWWLPPRRDICFPRPAGSHGCRHPKSTPAGYLRGVRGSRICQRGCNSVVRQLSRRTPGHSPVPRGSRCSAR